MNPQELKFEDFTDGMMCKVVFFNGYKIIDELSIDENDIFVKECIIYDSFIGKVSTNVKSIHFYEDVSSVIANEMKIYSFHPNGHGSASFFTLAKNEEDAIKVLNKYVNDKYLKNGKLDYRADGWGTNYYTLEITEEGSVIENENE